MGLDQLCEITRKKMIVMLFASYEKGHRMNYTTAMHVKWDKDYGRRVIAVNFFRDHKKMGISEEEISIEALLRASREYGSNQ